MKGICGKENIMGLIRAASNAVRGTLADQWKEYFYCDALDADVLVARGVRTVNYLILFSEKYIPELSS